MRHIKYTTKIATVAVLCLLSSGTLRGQNPGVNLTTGNIQPAIRITYASEQITVAASAIGFTAATISPTCTGCPINQLRATTAICTVATDSIRILSSGTTPTASLGLVVIAGGSFTVYGYTDIANFRAIRVTNTATIDCQYSRLP